MALSNLNALSVAMNVEQDSTVQALKLQLLQQQLAVERARMSAEDERGDHERTRASIAETRQKLDSVRLSLPGVDIILNQALQEIIAAPDGPGDANHRQQLMVKTAVDAVVDARRSVRKISNESAM